MILADATTFRLKHPDLEFCCVAFYLYTKPPVFETNTETMKTDPCQAGGLSLDALPLETDVHEYGEYKKQNESEIKGWLNCIGK